MIAASRRLVGLLTLAASAGYVARAAITVVAPGMMNDFGLTQTQMGSVFSAFLLGYTLFQVPSGALADRSDARQIFLVVCGGWTLLTALTAMVGWGHARVTFALAELWIIRALFGIVSAPTYPTSGRSIAVAVPASARARANSIVLASVGIGSAITPLLLAPLASRYGWREALGVPVALCSIAGAVWWRFGPDERGLAESGARGLGPEPDETSERAHPLRLRGFWFLFASYFLQAYLGYIFVFWFFLYLVQVRHFDVLNAAAFTALPWIATIFAIPIGGALSDAAVVRWGPTLGRRIVPGVALSAAAIFLVAGARTPNAAVAVTALTVCTVLVLCTEGPFWATMTQLAGRRSGLAGGTMNFGGNLGGLISPTLTPWLAGLIGWERTLTLTAGLAVVAGALWLGVGDRGNKP